MKCLLFSPLFRINFVWPKVCSVSIFLNFSLFPPSFYLCSSRWPTSSVPTKHFLVSSLASSELRERTEQGRGMEVMLICVCVCLCVCVCVRRVQCCVLPLPWRHLLSHTHHFCLTLWGTGLCVTELSKKSLKAKQQRWFILQYEIKYHPKCRVIGQN